HIFTGIVGPFMVLLHSSWQFNGLAGVTLLLTGVIVKPEAMRAAVLQGFATATDLADYLVRKNIPFRQAHAIVGRTVAFCLSQGKELTELSLAELKTFSEAIENDVFAVLSIAGSVNSRVSHGGTAGSVVAEALNRAEQALGIDR
ncbi:MAG: hypothetical protein KKG34_06645, partial [Proteobacteria bacterium]|nr:hypothetical protein [Pseudomonadota bacterium]